VIFGDYIGWSNLGIYNMGMMGFIDFINSEIRGFLASIGIIKASLNNRINNNKSTKNINALH